MKKSDKKIENSIIQSLNKACTSLLTSVEGFKWLTHFVDYNQFPASLLVLCVFESNQDLTQVKVSQHDLYIQELIKEHLATINIKPFDKTKQVKFDTEEQCEIELQLFFQNQEIS